MRLKAFTLIIIMVLSLPSCKKKSDSSATNIVFLHHSVGLIIWGTETSFKTKVAWRMNNLYNYIGKKDELPMMFKDYNEMNGSNYKITKIPFPKTRPYGWHNNPHDYYNIWVKNAGEKAYLKEPTLEMLTKEYQVIILKHCFPVSKIKAADGNPEVDSQEKTIANYQLQYEALRTKFHEFPDTKFILFTGAVPVKSEIQEDDARRAREFFDWVKNQWDQPGDNIHIWDLHELQTEGGLYFLEEHAESPHDSHPSNEFANQISPLLFNRIIDVIENDGRQTNLKGEAL